MSRKSRRSGRPAAPTAPTASVPEPEDADPYAPYADKEWDFHFVGDIEPEVVDEPALHALMRDWRHGRATRTLGQALSDAYFTLFAVVLLGAMVTNAILSAQHAAAQCGTAACASGRFLVPWSLFFAVAALTLSLGRLFGPVMASAAEGFWLMEAPISRARLLRGRLWAAIGLPFVLGAALAALVAALVGESGPVIVSWALGTGLVASALIAWAAFEQTLDRTGGTRVAQIVASAAAVVSVAVMSAVSAGWMAAPALAWLTVAPAILAVVSVVVVVAAGLAAHRRLDELRRARVLGGGALVSGLQGAMFALDFGLARDILVERDAVARGHVTPRAGRWQGLWALVWRDLQRVVRFPKPLFGLVAAMAVPYWFAAMGLGVLNPLLSGLALLVALIPFLGTLRVLSRTGGLARALPFSTGQLRTTAMVVPALLAVVWSWAAMPAMTGVLGGVTRDWTDAAAVSLATATAGLLGAVRWTTAQPVDFNTPMLATGAGALPPTLLFNLARGIDVVALVTAPLLLGASPLWSFGLAAVVFAFLRSGFNMTELSEEAKEQQRALDAQRGGKADDKKIRIPNPR